MFKIFKSKKDKPSVMYGAYQRLGIAVERRQRKAADFLNAKAANLNRKQLLVGLISFALLFGSGAGLVIWTAFHQPAKAMRVQSIRVPQHTLLPKDIEQRERWLTKEEINHIRSFRRYLDSLQQTVNGKTVYDSIARYRPGLLDSLAFVEKLYHEHLKTSEDGRKK